MADEGCASAIVLWETVAADPGRGFVLYVQVENFATDRKSLGDVSS